MTASRRHALAARSTGLQAPLQRDKWQLDAAHARLALAQQERARCQDARSALEQRCAAAQVTQAAATRIDPVMQVQRLAYLMAQHQALDDARTAERAQQGAVNKAMQACTDLQQRLGVLADLHEQRVQAALAETARRNERHVDDEWLARQCSLTAGAS